MLGKKRLQFPVGEKIDDDEETCLTSVEHSLSERSPTDAHVSLFNIVLVDNRGTYTLVRTSGTRAGEDQFPSNARSSFMLRNTPIY